MWNFLVFIVIGLVAGWLAGQLWKGKGFGLFGNLGIGIAGSFVGGFLLPLIGFAAYGFIAQIIAAVIGALILLWIINKIRK